MVDKAKKRTLVRGYLFSTVVNFNQRCFKKRTKIMTSL
nr:MAG TPA: hypothetical protein [Caudoviricetes sp.]